MAERKAVNKPDELQQDVVEGTRRTTNIKNSEEMQQDAGDRAIRKTINKNIDMPEEMQQDVDSATRKVVIKNADMSEEMQQYAIDCATQAMEKYVIEKDVASYLKQEFDKKYNPTWHCFVGRNFGSNVAHETRHYIYFYLGQMGFLLFKSG